MSSPFGRAVGVALAALVLLGGCASGKIPLEYQFGIGENNRYEWRIETRTTINSTSEQSVTTLNLVVDVEERVENNILTLELTPRSLAEGTRSLPTPEPVTVRYRLGRRGQILRLESEELAEQALSALQLGSTLVSSRIALPEEPVGIGDRWETPFLMDGDLGNIDLTGQGTLLGFELRGKRKLARIETTRTGEIETYERRGGVPVHLRGTTTSLARSSLDVDDGVLYATTTESESDFSIASAESGKLLGTMNVVLSSELELQPA